MSSKTRIQLTHFPTWVSVTLKMFLRKSITHLPNYHKMEDHSPKNPPVSQTCKGSVSKKFPSQNFTYINPFQSNFSANHILPIPYLSTPSIPATFLRAQPHEYNAQSHVHIKTHGLARNRKRTTCAICWPKSVLHEEKRRTGSNSGAGATKTCRTSSDIRAEQENYNVRQGPT